MLVSMNCKAPEVTCVLSDLSWCMKASFCSNQGFADGGNNPHLPGVWRKGWCPLVDGCWLTPSPTVASSSTPAVTRCFLPHLVFISQLTTLQFLFSGLLLGNLFSLPWPTCSCCWTSLKALPKCNREPRRIIFCIFYCSQNYQLEWIYLKTGLKISNPFLVLNAKDTISYRLYSLTLSCPVLYF